MTQQKERVYVFDTTLRDGEQSPGCSMNQREKLAVAHQLARLGVDVMEAGFPISSPGDFDSVRRIAEEVGAKPNAPTIAGLSRAREKDITVCADAVRAAIKPRIHTFIATSPIHMEYKLKMSPDEVVRQAVEMVALAKSLVDDVEFSLEDAGRTDWKFMVEIVEATISAGSTTINIPDTVGYCQPTQFAKQIRYLRENCPNIDQAIISVHCHNDLGLAVANTLAAVEEGARQVECTINGIGERAGNASLEEIVMNFKTRPDYFNVDTGVKTEEVYRASRLICDLTGSPVQPNKAIVGANAFAHEAGIHQDGVLKHSATYEIMTPESVGWTGEGLILGKHSGRHAFRKRVESLGYALTEEEINGAFDRFKVLCDKKKDVYEEDLIALVDDIFFKSVATWELAYLAVNSGTDAIPTATVKLRRGDEEIAEAAQGDGPVDAAFKAIERAIGEDVELHDYRLESVTGGRDALGRVMVALSRKDCSRQVKGRAVHTDIVTASALAYVTAMNHLQVQEGLAERESEPATI